MKGWKDIVQELNETHKRVLDKSVWYHEDCVSAILKELIIQFKEVYEIDDEIDDVIDGDYEVDFGIDVRDIRELIRELDK
jgi:hypothetical protein